MIIRSEKTGKEYATVDECLAAEKKYDEAIAARKKQEKLREEAKEAKRIEVKTAKEKYYAARQEYIDKLDEFNKEYSCHEVISEDERSGHHEQVYCNVLRKSHQLKMVFL